MYSREERTRLTGEINDMSAFIPGAERYFRRSLHMKNCRDRLIISSGFQEKGGCPLIRACSVITSNTVLLLVYLCLHDIAPQYLAEMLTTHAATRSLRSSDKQLLVVPRSKLKRHGDRSFNVVAPVLWNSLPESMKSSSSVASFKRTLKTFLFRQEYGVIN